MSNKLRIGIVFGGRSGEHEVSLRSARSVIEAIDKSKYEAVPIAITKEGNWLGSAALVITSANSAEPGYAAQIPVAFGGSATPPGGAPSLAGPGVANIDYTPWLDVGTDTAVAFGFQGDFSTLHVDDDSPQVGATGRVQEGVNLVSGSTVLIAAGAYSENVVISSNGSRAPHAHDYQCLVREHP